MLFLFIFSPFFTKEDFINMEFCVNIEDNTKLRMILLYLYIYVYGNFFLYKIRYKCVLLYSSIKLYKKAQGYSNQADM